MDQARIILLKGDITRSAADAIVNAANSSLLGGGGVDGAIHRAAGPLLLDACNVIIARQGSCKTGEAVITTGGDLAAKYVIHTVGPVWQGGDRNESVKLASCYRNSLQLAADHHLSTIAFPNISTGIYGYPKRGAALVVISAVSSWLEKEQLPQTVQFICFDDENYQIYHALLS